MRIFATLLFALTTLIALQASEPFNGRLFDFKGKPIKGAKIYIHNPKQYAKSDKEGKFGLTDVKPTDTLHIRVKGHTYDLPVEGAKGMSIKIEEAKAVGHEDEQLIRMGIGYVKMREYLGPISSVTGEKLAATGHSDLIQAMRVLIPGIHISKDGKNIIIRNSVSFHASTAPLWVIDGSESPEPPSLTVMEVERVEVLKDGGGYGLRGANGVIIVTLKGSK